MGVTGLIDKSKLEPVSKKRVALRILTEYSDVPQSLVVPVLNIVSSRQPISNNHLRVIVFIIANVSSSSEALTYLIDYAAVFPWALALQAER